VGANGSAYLNFSQAYQPSISGFHLIGTESVDYFVIAYKSTLEEDGWVLTKRPASQEMWRE
jgi:hypothetical protein